MGKSEMVKDYEELKEKHKSLRGLYNAKCDELNQSYIDNCGLKQRIVELENEIKALVVANNEENKVELPCNPMEVALMLINSEFAYETSSFQRALGSNEYEITERYTIDELEQIAEHLLIHCRHNSEE